MRGHLTSRASLPQLLTDLSDDLRTFFKQETKLLKKEMSEKVSVLRRHAIILGTGNFLAVAGSILLLASIGFLLAFAFQTAGLKPLLAVFLGFVAIGLLVMGAGAVLSIKGFKAISHDSLTPQRTINAVTGAEIPSPSRKEPSDAHEEPSAAHLHVQALATKQRIDEEQQELRHRMAPAQLKKSVIQHIIKHPIPWIGVASVCALTGGYFFNRKLRRGISLLEQVSSRSNFRRAR